MKTLFHSTLRSTSVAILLLASLFSMTASAAAVIVERGASNPDIKKVIVTGNTLVKLVHSDKEFVSIDQLDLNKVSVKQIGNTLTIGSSEDSPVLVFVYVKDIYRIVASDKADVSTSGKFNMTNLQVILKDDARARVKATTQSLYTVVTDHAQLKLIGNSVNHISNRTGFAKVNTDQFAALNIESVASSEGAVALNASKNRKM